MQETGFIPRLRRQTIFSITVNIYDSFGESRRSIGYEAIRDASTHSGASQLEIELAYSSDLALRISDNGVGIDPAVADRSKKGHFGLQGMRERVTASWAS